MIAIFISCFISNCCCRFAKMNRLLSSVKYAALVAQAGVAAQYLPTWDSLDTRPLPSWYDEAKVGIFIHWGVFSVPSFGTASGGASGEWFWWNWQGAKTQAYIDFITKTEAPSFSYADYATRFDATFYNGTSWAQLFKSSGAKYVVLTR